MPQTSVGTLFGPYDENLRHVEALLNVKIRTQGHELMVDGHPRDTARVERWVGQVSGLLGDGHSLSDTDIRTAAQLVSDDESVDLARALPEGRPAAPRRQAPHHRQVGQPAALPRRHREARHRLRHRPGRHRQDLPGDGPGGERAAGQEGGADRPGPPGGRSRREARLPARRPAGKGQPVPAAALRRALRHARRRTGAAAARARHDRGGADRLHARPHPERRLRDPRRGAEHRPSSR